MLPLADGVLASDSGTSRAQRWQAQYERVCALLNLRLGNEVRIEARRRYEAQRDGYRSPGPERLLVRRDLQAIPRLPGDRDESERQLAEAQRSRRIPTMRRRGSSMHRSGLPPASTPKHAELAYGQYVESPIAPGFVDGVPAAPDAAGVSGIRR